MAHGLELALFASDAKEIQIELRIPRCLPSWRHEGKLPRDDNEYAVSGWWQPI